MSDHSDLPGREALASLLQGASGRWRTARISTRVRALRSDVVTTPGLGWLARRDGFDPYEHIGGVDYESWAWWWIERTDEPRRLVAVPQYPSGEVVEYAPYGPKTRFRCEEELDVGSHRVRFLAARNGWEWWCQWDPAEIVHHRVDDDCKLRIDDGWPAGFLSPEEIAEDCELSVTGTDVVAGRRAWVVQARPGPSAQPPPSVLAVVDPPCCWEIEDFELAVDAELGVLLRLVAREAGHPLLIEEFTEVHFDEDLPAAVFRVLPDPGLKVIPSELSFPGFASEE